MSLKGWWRELNTDPNKLAADSLSKLAKRFQDENKALQARLTVAEDYVKKCRCLTCKQALSVGEKEGRANG
jgi:hypothetical protein